MANKQPGPFDFPYPGRQEGYPPDRRFDKDFPANADGFQQPPNAPGTTDRFPRRDVVLPVPPPRTNGGADGMGAPPRRDTRRSRAQGQNVAAVVLPNLFTEARPTLSAQLASWDTGPDENGEESSQLMAFFKAYDFAENAVTGIGSAPVVDPFKGVVSHQLNTPLAVLQALEVIANLQWGHDGVNEKVVMNMPAGQIIKGSPYGTYCRANAKLTCRYFKRQQAADFGTTHIFFYLDADPNKANNIFNSIDSPALSPSIGFDPGTIPTMPIHIEGIIGLGSGALGQGGSFDRSSRITRRFFGTFPVAGPYNAGVGGAFVRCPVAFGASAVMLQAISGTTAFVDPAGRSFAPLMFGMLNHSGTITLAQLVPNTFFPLDSETAEIFVYNPGVGNGFENPFSLIYDLGL
jgi:hypothetical protein